MTAKPDLAALARELRATMVHAVSRGLLSAWASRLDNMAAVLSEPAAEADSDLEAEVKLRLQHELTIDALRAQLAETEQRADTAEVHERELRAIALDYERARDALAAAAPLFEAAHAYEHAWTRKNTHQLEQDSVCGNAMYWARSEAGQRWKREQGK